MPWHPSAHHLDTQGIEPGRQRTTAVRLVVREHGIVVRGTVFIEVRNANPCHVCLRLSEYD